jgi:hypothetical protein
MGIMTEQEYNMVQDFWGNTMGYRDMPWFQELTYEEYCGQKCARRNI